MAEKSGKPPIFDKIGMQYPEENKNALPEGGSEINELTTDPILVHSAYGL